MFIAGLLKISLKTFHVCKQFDLSALAHQYSFPYSPFQINDQPIDSNWMSKFLSMLDMEDVRQDLTEHFGVVGDRIVGSFRSQPSFLQYSEADHLIQTSQQPVQVTAVTRVKDRNYGTYSGNVTSQKSSAIGRDNKNYKIVKIEDNETPQSSGQGTSSRNTNSMTQSTTSTNSSFGINVSKIDPNDPINYRNPDA